ncbi:hypothetical protein CDCA_CDCA08G2390 [Cyanidium caldarium]|uniref:Kinesin motor domain-containing protein n=1 Tax=Cyanidium caldarium TaxID=2771 RepID=A0AAV9IW69_CYACA|nr:hypothetical protein CDCA_CDCA08G2390 [Cyanidium caldarium]
MASAGLSETMGGRLGTASPTTSLELPPWLQARLPVGVVVQVRPRLRTERLAGVTLCGAADESVYACDGEQSTVSDVISGETYDFDGALVVDGSSGIEAVYMDAAFRSAVDPQGNTSGPPRLPVWSIQDAVQAVLRGLTNLVVFTYGGQCTGKTFLLSRVLQLAMEERLGGAHAEPLVRSFTVTRYFQDDAHREAEEAMVVQEDVSRRQALRQMQECLRAPPDRSASCSPHWVFRVVLDSGRSLTFADLASSSRVTPRGTQLTEDLALFTLEQGVLDDPAHLTCSPLTGALRSGLGGDAIGVVLCCLGPTHFHRENENAQTLAMARRLMEVCASLRFERPDAPKAMYHQ